VTAGFYSAAHPSALNKQYVADYKKATGHRANYISVGGYDGMHLIYETLKKTGGKTDADSVLAAMKGMSLGKPARPDLDRSADSRHHSERLHPQGREGGRRTLGRRVQDLRSGQRSSERR
jgi:ABC-type branched-subunit amino acid transport system substrate-binding protein